MVKQYGAPAGFVYTHSELDARSADEHAQLRWALMAAKHLKAHLQTPPPASTEGVGRCLFLAIARMGNEGRLGVESAGTGGFPATSDPLPGVLQAQRGAASNPIPDPSPSPSPSPSPNPNPNPSASPSPNPSPKPHP